MTASRLQRMCAVLDRRQPDLGVIMAGVHKEHNVSAVLRTADAVGVLEVHSMDAVSAPALRRTAHAGVGRRVALHHHEDVEAGCARLREQGMRLYATVLSADAVDFRAVDYTGPCAIMLGAELHGVPPRAAAQADGHLTIPMMGLAESLNVSVAAAVILYEAQRQRLAAGLYDRCRLDPERYRRLLFEWMHPRIARYCRQHGLDYPEMDDDGDLAGPPPG